MIFRDLKEDKMLNSTFIKSMNYRDLKEAKCAQLLPSTVKKSALI